MFTGRKFSPILAIQKNLNFPNAVKIAIGSMYVIINTAQKKLWNKNFAHEGRRQKRRKFFLSENFQLHHKCNHMVYTTNNQPTLLMYIGIAECKAEIRSLEGEFFAKLPVDGKEVCYWWSTEKITNIVTKKEQVT